ncbi:MAG: ImmA/IrrE family metallo-endopeptidase [Selenomonadaceae bacterium]|nr:ImmA/IrrE family metallo-endopeptidase [Selenomonadaceae bacterium]
MEGNGNLETIHPGKYLADKLSEQSMSRKELAIRTGFSEKHVSTVINGQKSISPSFAKKLEYALKIPASDWLNRQNEYDSALLDYEEKNNISAEELAILKPLKDILEYMNQFQLLPKTLSEPEKILELRKLLRVSSLSVIPKIPYNAAYRAQISNNVAVDAYVLYAWQCLCELLTEKVPLDNTLDKDLLRNKLSEIKSLMLIEPNAMREQLTKIFVECGIAFCIVKHFRGAPVQGFIKHTERGHLILCMTIRQKRADIFWFTLFHEIAHVLNGDADERFVDFSSVKTEIEARADEFARDFLLDKSSYKNFLNADDFSESAVKEFATSQNVLPCIVTGRLQSDGIIGWDCLSSTLRYYEWSET